MIELTSFLSFPFVQRALVAGVLLAIVGSLLGVFVVLKRMSFFSDAIAHASLTGIAIGLLLGFGTIIGDLVESFFKRRLNYESGKPFVPFDQIDFVLGAMIFVFPIVNLSINKIFIIIILSFVLHILVNHIAFYLKIRNEKW